MPDLLIKGGVTMWTQGITNGFKWCVKHYQEGSIYGINGGRISKLWIQREYNCETIANYDRGWDIEPTEATAADGMEVYKMLLEKYN